jgi:hypothetical protein
MPCNFTPRNNRHRDIPIIPSSEPLSLSRSTIRHQADCSHRTHPEGPLLSRSAWLGFLSSSRSVARKVSQKLLIKLNIAASTSCCCWATPCGITVSTCFSAGRKARAAGTLHRIVCWQLWFDCANRRRLRRQGNQLYPVALHTTILSPMHFRSKRAGLRRPFLVIRAG